MPRALVLSVLLSISMASVAQADVLPSGPETCTLELMAAAHHTGCVSCGTSFQAPTACETAHASDGLVRACRTGGASVWTEIWCAPDAAPPPTTTAPPVMTAPPVTTSPPTTSAPVATVDAPRESGSCSASPAGGTSSALVFVLGSLVLRSLRSRRRDRADQSKR